jgi:hypothetical protein
MAIIQKFFWKNFNYAVLRGCFVVKKLETKTIITIAASSLVLAFMGGLALLKKRK